MAADAGGSRGLDPRIFVAIVEESPTSVMITDFQGNIEYVNRKFSLLTGYAQEEVIGRNPRFLKSGVQQPEVYTNLWKTIAGGREWRGELCNRKKSGELYWELAAISAIRDSEGDISHYLAVKEDITDRKVMEGQLWQAKATAEAANRAKSRFLADMSHELRTPLNSILGFSQLMELQGGESLSDKQREYLRWIRDGGEHLLDMVNDVLDLSKVEAGKIELEKAPFDPGALIRRVLTTVRSLAAKKHLHIDTALPKEPGVLDADEVRVKQILYNLLSNAIKFTEREKRIGVEAKSDHGELAVTVWDEGIGIPADQQGKLFQKFSRVDSPQSKEIKGSGLGLWICREIIRAHGGQIWVESHEGRGSTFAFTLKKAHPDTTME